MTDADLQADLDAIAKITERWKFPDTTFVLVVLPEALETDRDMILHSNFDEQDVPNILRAVADDVEEGEVIDVAQGKPQ